MTLINEHHWIVAGADDFFIFHTKINPYAKFGTFVRRVTCLDFFALKPPDYVHICHSHIIRGGGGGHIYIG